MIKLGEGGVSYNISAARQSSQSVLRKSTVLWAKWASFLIELHLFLKEKLTNYNIETYGWQFPKNEWSETITSRKITYNIFQWMYLSFKVKIRIFLKTCICHHELDCFPVLTDFSDKIRSDINEWFCWFCIMKCQCLEALYNSVKQYFPDDQCNE